LKQPLGHSTPYLAPDLILSCELAGSVQPMTTVSGPGLIYTDAVVLSPETDFKPFCSDER